LSKPLSEVVLSFRRSSDAQPNPKDEQMFHPHFWKTLKEVAAAGCNARVFMLTFMVGRNRSASEADAAKPTPRAEEDR